MMDRWLTPLIRLSLTASGAQTVYIRDGAGWPAQGETQGAHLWGDPKDQGALCPFINDVPRNRFAFLIFYLWCAKVELATP